MTDEARLKRWIATRGGGVGPHPSEHIDMDTLIAYARVELTAAHARLVDEHLYVCEDGRCPEYVREQGGSVGAQQQAPPSSLNGAAAAGDGVHERTFQSREIIWNTFESMSREVNVSIDELVNEAMTAYAKVRGYGVVDNNNASAPQVEASSPKARPGTPGYRRDPLEETQDAGSMVSALDRSYSPARAPEDPDDDDLARTSARGPFLRPGRAPQQQLPPAIDPLDPGEETRTAPRMNSPMPRGRIPSPAPAAPPQRQPIEPYAARPPPLPPRSFPPTTMPMPGSPQRAQHQQQQQQERRLSLAYQGRSYNVEKERFLLGRSKTQADLRLDDPNVSRQHAVIEKVGSAFYLVDLGSTNGVHIAGERIARRAVADGDVITITSHEIRVSLR